MAFADSLPPQDRKQYIAGQLQAWRILRLYCQFTHPPKEKFLFLIDTASDLRFFVISSGISKLIESQPRMRGTQVPIDAASHPCLSYDSIADCSRTYAITREDAEQQLMADLSRIKDLASTALRPLVIEAVQANPRMTEREKREILRCLT